MKTVRYILFTGLIATGIILSVLVGAFLTGRDSRYYDVFGQNELIEYSNSLLSIEHFVSEYKPYVFQNNTVNTPLLLSAYYEVISKKDRISIVYYLKWDNEINPNPAVHTLYSIFRAAYYGYPLYDIEYFQIDVNRQTGDIIRFLFETSIDEDYYQSIVEHYTFDGEFTGNVCQYKLINASDSVIKEDETDVLLTDSHVHIGSQTWNHLSVLLSEDISNYTIPLEYELEYLSNEEYKELKFSRKSQGDQKSKPSILLIIVSSLILLFWIRMSIKLATLFSKA